MRKILCLIAVFCMVLSVWSFPVSAKVVFCDFEEDADKIYYCDLDGDGKEDSLSVDLYKNYFGRYVFNINDRPFIFQVVRHGGYGDVRIIDIDETDKFLDIFITGTYKGTWGEVYRYDGNQLYRNDGIIEFEYVEAMEVTAGGGKLTIECGPETFVYNEFNFVPVEVDTNEEYMEDGYYNQYTIEVDGEIVKFDQYPVNKNGRLLVPIRAIFEKMGYALVWDAETRTAHAAKGDSGISVQIGNKTIFYTVDGVSGKYECDVAPVILNDRTLIPLRGVVESAGSVVEWDEETGTARIATKK